MSKKGTPKETRFNDVEMLKIECRAETDDEKNEMILEGYAAMYDSKTRIGFDDWAFDEIIERGAFDGANLKDVPLKYNHSDEIPILARTRNKSLTLTPDKDGLKIRAVLLDTSDGRDMYKRVQAGLIDKMSFAFTVSDEEIDTTGKIPVRHIKKFDKIFDVSVVDTPAYENTSVYARSKEIADAWNIDRKKSADADGNDAVTMDIATKILINQYRKGN